MLDTKRKIELELPVWLRNYGSQFDTCCQFRYLIEQKPELKPLCGWYWFVNKQQQAGHISFEQLQGLRQLIKKEESKHETVPT